MRRIEPTTAFRRDFRREKRGRHRNLDEAVADIVQMVATDTPLPERNRNHDLSNNGSSYRECPSKPDLALRIGNAFRVSMDTLLRMQARHDTYIMRQTAREIEMKRYEWA